jgi:hypothetical protein
MKQALSEKGGCINPSINSINPGKNRVSTCSFPKKSGLNLGLTGLTGLMTLSVQNINCRNSLLWINRVNPVNRVVNRVISKVESLTNVKSCPLIELIHSFTVFGGLVR